jgi:hypothetical protein
MLVYGSSGTNDVDVEEYGRSETDETDDVEYEWVSNNVTIHFAWCEVELLETRRCVKVLTEQLEGRISVNYF